MTHSTKPSVAAQALLFKRMRVQKLYGFREMSKKVCYFTCTVRITQ